MSLFTWTKGTKYSLSFQMNIQRVFDHEPSLELTLQPNVTSPWIILADAHGLRFFSKKYPGLPVGFSIYCFLSSSHVIGILLSLRLCPFGTVSSRSAPFPPGLTHWPLAERLLDCTAASAWTVFFPKILL